MGLLFWVTRDKVPTFLKQMTIKGGVPSKDATNLLVLCILLHKYYTPDIEVSSHGAYKFKVAGLRIHSGVGQPGGSTNWG